MAKKKVIEKTQYHCRDCAHSYDWHEIGANGKPFMCRCPHSMASIAVSCQTHNANTSKCVNNGKKAKDNKVFNPSI